MWKFENLFWLIDKNWVNYIGKDLFRVIFGFDKKEEKINKLLNIDDNEEGEIVDDVDFFCVEELYIVFSLDVIF